MNTKLVDDIANAILYEGYLLYPYRASAIKNKQRWNFGVLYPREYAEKQSGADAWTMQTECLATADATATLEVRVRFLQLMGEGAMEHELELPAIGLAELAAAPESHNFVEAAVELRATQLSAGVFQIRVTIFNNGESFNSSAPGASREDALLHSLISTHTILSIHGGEFVSLLEPPEHLSEMAAACQNIGTWPVLVGEPGSRDSMLSSPIILYDYPQIAPESPGALFDGTEIDEILTLRIMTLTDEEKLEVAQGDERARQILERTESMPREQFMKMHGVLRPATKERS
jgi:hypothetical protein